jgi:carboxyl-terminal processing protease
MGMGKQVCLLLSAAVFAAAASAAGPAAAELDAALAILKAHHINSGKADWPAIEARARARVAKADKAAEAYPVIKAVLGELGEHHSFLLPAAVVQSRRQAAPAVADGREEKLPLAEPYPGNILAIQLPGHSGSPDSDKAYADFLRRMLQKAYEKKLCRVLLDLRFNNGGNMWPMLNGLMPLLGKPPYGYFRNTDGGEAAWKLSDAEAVTKDQAGQQGRLPVAVLLGKATFSSGEFTAMAFEGRARTRFFGAPTGGYVTFNATYDLPDGAQLYVAEGWGLDRVRRPYRIAVVPDEHSAEGQATFEAGLAWLRTQPCPAARR